MQEHQKTEVLSVDPYMSSRRFAESEVTWQIFKPRDIDVTGNAFNKFYNDI